MDDLMMVPHVFDTRYQSGHWFSAMDGLMGNRGLLGGTVMDLLIVTGFS